MNYISYGGGVQSTAMVLMTLDDSAKSWKKSDVDLVIMADPGDEMPSTYETARLIEEKCKKMINKVKKKLNPVNPNFFKKSCAIKPKPCKP